MMTTETQEVEETTISLLDPEIINHELIGDRYQEFFRCSHCQLIILEATTPRHYFQNPAILSAHPVTVRCTSPHCSGQQAFQICLVCGEKGIQRKDRNNLNWWKSHKTNQNHQNAVQIFLENRQGDSIGGDANMSEGFCPPEDDLFDDVDELSKNCILKTYFSYEHEERGKGMRFLISKSLKCDDPKKVTQAEMNFHIQALLLGGNITRSAMEEVMMFTKACTEYAAEKETEIIQGSLLESMFLLERDGNSLSESQKEFIFKHLKISMEEEGGTKTYGSFCGTKPPMDYKEYQRFYWTGVNSLGK